MQSLQASLPHCHCHRRNWACAMAETSQIRHTSQHNPQQSCSTSVMLPCRALAVHHLPNMPTPTASPPSTSPTATLEILKIFPKKGHWKMGAAMGRSLVRLFLGHLIITRSWVVHLVAKPRSASTTPHHFHPYNLLQTIPLM